MSSRGRALLWGMVGVGLIARTVLAFKTYGVGYDIDSLKMVRHALATDWTHVYSAVNGHPYNRWPYPPGFLPFVTASGGLADLTGLALHGTVQLTQIAGDCAIAWFVQDHLGRRGASERTRLAAVALVAFGPPFWITSGFHGQIDAVAILPAVVALWLWERSPPGTRRALAAGALIGIGASMKIVPAMMVLVLLPSLRSRREAAALLVPAAAIPIALILPFLVADPHGVVDTYKASRFLPGFGGISLLVQPDLAGNWLNHDGNPLTGATRFLLDNEVPILALLMAPFFALAFLRRLQPTLAAALLWSALVVFNPGFEFEFVVWALPFVLMAGWIAQAAAVEAALLVPAAILYWHPFGQAPTGLYVAIMVAAWCVAVVAVVRLGLRLAREPRPPASRPAAAAG